MLPQKTGRLVKEDAVASYTYKEVPLAAPQGDELLVRVGKVALCGTDISLFQWNKGSLNCLSIAMVSMAPIQLQKKLPSFLSLLDMRWLGRYVVTYYFEVYITTPTMSGLGQLSVPGCVFLSQ